MRLNWGHKLIMVFIAFGGMMSYMVYRSVKTNYDLVSKEYYKDELAYQQVIDGTARANQLASKVSIGAENGLVIIRFPKDMRGDRVEGTAWFYYAPDARKDKKMALQLNEAGEQPINAKVFAAGNYTVKISWRYKDQPYYSEQRINIP